MEPLHLPTLLMVTAAVIAFTGVALAVLARGPHAAAALRCWGGAMLAGAAGLVLIAAGGRLPAAPGIAGNALILAGTALSWTGARWFIGVRLRSGWAAAGPLGWLALAALPGVPVLGLAFAAQVVGALYVLAAAAELWRGRREELPSRNVAVALLVVHGAIYLVRAGAMLADGAKAYSELFATVLLLEAMLHTVGLSLALLAMVKERAELHSVRQLSRLALVDGLTGLGNRRQFDALLAREHRQAVAERRTLSLLMLDVDCFKAFNDLYGHQAGDDALRALGAAVQGAVRRPGDLAARYGGEEFAVLLPRTDEAGARAVADAIHGNVARLGTPHAGSPYGRLSVSIGAATLRPGPGSDGGGLVRAADLALYAAKRGGRNRTVADAVARAGAARLALGPMPLAQARGD